MDVPWHSDWHQYMLDAGLNLMFFYGKSKTLFFLTSDYDCVHVKDICVWSDLMESPPTCTADL